ncbi:MAG: hypothetical protein ACRCU5_13795 [Rhizobiaceae bacterium]
MQWDNKVTPSNVIQIGLLLVSLTGIYYTLSGKVTAVEHDITRVEKAIDAQDADIQRLSDAKEDTNSRLIRIEERLIGIAEKLNVQRPR